MQTNFNRPLKTLLILSVLLSVFLVTGCDRQQPAPPPPPPAPVSIVTVKTQKIVLTTELPGRIMTYKIAQIRPQINGLVQKRLFIEGSDVTAGQILYQIDPTPFQAMVDSADANFAASQKSVDRAMAVLAMSRAGVTRQKATLELARINSQRNDTLARVDAVSEIQRDQTTTAFKVAGASLKAAEAQLESDRQAVSVAKALIRQAKAALDTARINRGYCNIVAPISGRIGKSNTTEGAIVTAYQPVSMATIQQLDPIYVDVPQSTIELQRLKRSLENGRLERDKNGPNKVKIILENGMTYPLEGTLQFSDVTVDPTTGSVILRMIFPNPKGDLLPGMFVRTVIKEGINDQGILIPQQGVSRDHKGNPLTLIVDAENKVGVRRLTLGRAVKDQWRVLTGLAPGDRVIVEGMQRLRPGMTVKPTPFKGGNSSQAPGGETNNPLQKPKDGGA